MVVLAVGICVVMILTLISVLGIGSVSILMAACVGSPGRDGSLKVLWQVITTLVKLTWLFPVGLVMRQMPTPIMLLSD